MSDYGAELRRDLARVLAEGRWLCVGTSAPGAVQMLTRIDEMVDVDRPSGGQPSPHLGLATYGHDPEPDPRYPVVELGFPSTNDFVADTVMMPRLLTDLSAEIQHSVDQWDPDEAALAIVPPFMPGEPIAGRQVFGGRPASWVALEDKLAIVDIWRRAGLNIAPSRDLPLDAIDELHRAHTQVGGSQGSVWAADNKPGAHGGGSGTYWVRDESVVASTAHELRTAGHDRVRVQPFLIGTPCSIHGVVLAERTVGLRPNEMLIFVDPEAGRFRYAQAATFWDPAADQREEMVSAAIAVGEELRAAVGFRGVFSLDGVMTGEGFRPTEVNPRYGVALRSILPTSDGILSMFILNMAIVDEVIDVDADRFEDWLVPLLDDTRAGHCSVITDNPPANRLQAAAVTDSGGDLSIVEDATDAVAEISWTPFGDRGVVSFNLTERWPTGAPAAPVLADLVAEIDRRWQCGAPKLVPALSVG